MARDKTACANDNCKYHKYEVAHKDQPFFDVRKEDGFGLPDISIRIKRNHYKLDKFDVYYCDDCRNAIEHFKKLKYYRK